MSNGPGAEGSSSQSNWRGGDNEPQAAKYQWQDSHRSESGAVLPKRRHRWRPILLACGFLALLGWMLSIILKTPSVTPMIVMSATDYDETMPPNSWAIEDIDDFDILDGNSVQLGKVNFNSSGDESFGQLRSSLAQTARTQAKTLILYVTSHASVDIEGRPCLIPPSADPLNEATWIPVSKIVEEVNRTQRLASKKKLIVLDCVRGLANWDIGVSFETFVERVGEQFKNGSLGSPNTAIMTASAPGQAAWTSADLNGTVFGQYLQVGLGRPSRSQSSWWKRRPQCVAS